MSGISYSPQVSYHGDMHIAAAGSSVANSINQFVERTREEQKKREYLAGLAGTMVDPRTGQIAGKDLESFLKQPNDKIAGAFAGLAQQRQEQQDGLRQQLMTQQLQAALQEFSQRAQLFPIQKQTAQTAATTAATNAAAEPRQRAAETNLTEAKAWEAWQGRGDEPVKLDPAIDPATNKPIPGIAFNRKTGQQVSTVAPNANPPGEWVKDPNDPSGTKYIGLMQGNGDMKFLPRPSDVVELIQRGIIKLPETTAPVPLQAAQTPVPTATPSADKFVVGQKYKDAQGNTATYVGNGQWQ